MTENEISGIIVDLSVKIHKALGPGLLESVYEEILFYELTQEGLRGKRQVAIPVIYDELKIKKDITFKVIEDKLLKTYDLKKGTDFFNGLDTKAKIKADETKYLLKKNRD